MPRFNGLDIGRALPMPLSTARSNRFRIGKIAVEQILSQPERSETPQTIHTGFEIVEGDGLVEIVPAAEDAANRPGGFVPGLADRGRRGHHRHGALRHTRHRGGR
jgi:hypothetical protein